jgi:hypothetical protein
MDAVTITIRDNKLDGAALLRIARELREILTADCEGCRRRVRREAIEGCDPPSYVHYYGTTVAPCLCNVVASALEDVDRVADVGAWLWATSPIVLPISLPVGGLPAAGLIYSDVPSATASATT